MLIGRFFNFLDDIIFSFSWPLPFILVIVLVAIWVLVEYLRKIFDISGAVAFFIMGVIVLWTIKFEGLFLLLFSFEISIVAKKICAIRDIRDKNLRANISFGLKSSVCNPGNPSFRLDLVQVLSRGLMAMLSSLIWYVTGSLSSLVMFGASIAEVLANTLASSIGSLSKRTPVSIRNFMPVSKGFSGAVTPLGILSSFIASIIVGVLWVLLFLDVQVYETVKIIAFCSVISFTAFMGSIIDSYLGSCVQAHYINPKTGQLTEKPNEDGVDFELSYGIRWIDNDMVNLLSNIFSAVFSLGMALLLV